MTSGALLIVTRFRKRHDTIGTVLGLPANPTLLALARYENIVAALGGIAKLDTQ